MRATLGGTTLAEAKALMKRQSFGVKAPESQLAEVDRLRAERIQATRTAERARIKEILSSPEAAERPVAARGVALRSSFTPEEAADFLRTLPPEAIRQIRQAMKGGPSMGFAQYMKNLNPSVPPSYDPESASLFGSLEPRFPDSQSIYARRAADRAQATPVADQAHRQEPSS